MTATQLKINLTQQEQDELNEIRRVRTSDGKTETRQKFLKFREGIKLTFSLFAKAHGFKFEPKYDDDFEALCETYAIRSDLMHPKKPFDLDVSDIKFGRAMKGSDWLLREYWELLRQTEEFVDYLKTAQHVP